MAEDFLHEPLGQEPKRAAAPGRARRILFTAAAVVLIAAGTVFVWRVAAPSAGRPAGVVAAIEPAKPIPPPAAPEAKTPVVAATPPTANDADTTGGITVVRPPGSSGSVGQFIPVPQDLNVSLAPAPDPRLVEQTRLGHLPRRGPDGARPADVYARPVVTDAGLPSNAPRVALMIGGMGLNAAMTARAVHDLPPAVTLGFAPYGDNIEQQVQAARSAGHEAVLQLPMEGYGDPAAASMSHLLTTGLDGKDLIDRLHWLMSRFTGYAGVANFLGGKFTGDEVALAPVLRDVANRGLYYLDDNSSPRTLVPGLAPSVGLPVVQATATLDDAKDAAALNAMLDPLRRRAKDRGCAVAVAGGLPASIDRIVDFARSLAAKGVALVPLSACVDVARPTSARAQP